MKNDILTNPPGTEDVHGTDMVQREAVLASIKGVYESYGFEPLHTPAIEHRDVFKGHHGEGEKIQFHFTDNHGKKLMLRYDLTVPLARFIASHPEIPRPFKRYQIAPSFRDDSPDKGHHREFVQCDADVIGVKDSAVDAEVVMMAIDGLKRLGFENFKIRINHRGIIRAMADMCCGFGSDILQIQRALDYADKYVKRGAKGIRKDLLKRGLSGRQASNVLAWLNITGSCVEVLDALAQRFIGHYWALQAVGDLRAILKALPRPYLKYLIIDLSLARGADYYTGFIVEGFVPGIPVGAVLGGGRYDDLMAKFSGNSEPAVGMAFGLERILKAMSLLSIRHGREPSTVLVHPVGAESVIKAARAADMLRKSGLNIDFCPVIYSKDDAKAYAVKRRYKAVITWKGESDYEAMNTDCNGGHTLKLCRGVLHPA